MKKFAIYLILAISIKEKSIRLICHITKNGHQSLNHYFLNNKSLMDSANSQYMEHLQEVSLLEQTIFLR
jgi:hypothetical protein